MQVEGEDVLGGCLDLARWLSGLLWMWLLSCSYVISGAVLALLLRPARDGTAAAAP